MMLNGAIPPGIEVPPPAEWTARHAGGDARGDARRRRRLASGDPAAWSTAIDARHAVLAPVPPARSRPRRGRPRASRSSATRSHAMLPTLGKGANMAMRNAAVLRDALVAARPRRARRCSRRSAPTRTTCASATYPLMELAADHGRFGGGGLRGPSAEEVHGMRVLGLSAGNPDGSAEILLKRRAARRRGGGRRRSRSCASTTCACRPVRSHPARRPAPTTARGCGTR